jgi:hypothetical protein
MIARTAYTDDDAFSAWQGMRGKAVFRESFHAVARFICQQRNLQFLDF